MKFYYINNSLCEGCDDCSVACPSAAVYARGGKRYIIHDKCTSCGACIRTCAHNAVSVESIDAMVERMENADLYLSRIRRLEKEVATLNERLDNGENNIRILVERYPSALAVCDVRGQLLMYNTLFRNISPGGVAAQGTAGNLSGFVPAETASMLLQGASSRAEAFTAEISGKNYSIEAVKLKSGEVICIFDDLSSRGIAAARISEALDRAILRQMETVRKIGTILGDETSSALNEINRALELLQSADGETGD